MEEGLQIEADEFISLAGREERAAVSQLAEPIVRLREKLRTRLREQANTVKETILRPDVFCVTWEQIPGRGAFEMQQEELIGNARRAASMARFMNSNFPSVTVPEKLIEELEGLRRDQVVETSLQISTELIGKMKPSCQSVYFIPAG